MDQQSGEGRLKIRNAGRTVLTDQELGMTVISKRFRFLVLPVAAILLLAACLSTNLPPIGSTGSFTPEDDELQLWQALRQAEGKVLPPKMVFNEPSIGVVPDGDRAPRYSHKLLGQRWSANSG